MLVLAGAIPVVAGTGPRAGADPGPAACPWVGSSAPVATRVSELMAKMTEAQMLSMLGGLDSNTDPSSSGPVYAGETPAIPSLCIPALHLEDGPAGVGDGLTGVTQLPAPVALAASWDPALANAYGEVVGAEQRAKGTNVELGPTVNVVRDPRWGRAFETFGEDPYLSGQIGAAEIEGVQSQGVIAMVKHLAVYNEESLRDAPPDNAVVSDRAMQEIYLPAFQAAVTQGHAGAVMCAYNLVNGIPACQSPYLLSQVLDGQFGFGGFVTSDWFATKSSAPSVAAGLDMQMPTNCYYGQALTQDLADGAVTQSQVADMVGRVLRVMFAVGLFDQPQTGDPAAPATTPAHAALARQAAEEGAVLLQNTGHLLPLGGRALHSVAVISSDGGGGAVTAGGGSAAVTAAAVVSPFDAIARRAGSAVHVSYDDGTNLQSAAAAARAAQVAVVFAGLPESESQDLATIGLPPGDDQLIETVAAANPHTVVVLNTGSAVAMPWVHRVAGVVEAWYPGQEDGNAIAAVLFGDVDPSGKLPVTVPVDLSQVPAHTPQQWPGLGTVQYSEGVFVGYRYYDASGETPLFPFGYGLSYTTFGFSHPQISSANGKLEVTASVTNTGARAGADVVQLYVHDSSLAQEPPEQLKRFQRVVLQPGQTGKVTFTLDARDFAFWDSATQQWTVAPGSYQVRLGDSSRHLPEVFGFKLLRGTTVGAPVPDAPPALSPVVSAMSAVADAQCVKDTVAPLVNAGLTVGGDLWSLTGQPLSTLP